MASIFLKIILFPMIIVGVVSLCAWLLSCFIPHYLSTSHTYGSINVTPYGYHAESLIIPKWDSLLIESDDFKVKFRDIVINIAIPDINLRGVKLTTGEVDFTLKKQLEEGTTEKQNSDSTEIKFPQKLKFHLPVHVQIGKTQIALPDGKLYKFENFDFRSKGKNAGELSADSIEAKELPHKICLKTDFDFQGTNVNLNASVKSLNDSLNISTSSPKSSILQVTSKIDADVKNIQKWLPFPWPEDAPNVEKANVVGEVSIDPKTKDYSFSGTLKTHMDEFYPLLALDAVIDFDGNNQGFHANGKFKNDEGGTIELDGDIFEGGNANFYGHVSNMNAEFGPQIMPLDVKIHSAELKGKKLHANLETRNGSYVTADLDFENEFNITYVGDISPYEPWAIDWSTGDLVFSKPFKAYGTFRDGKMRALVKFDTIPYAYTMTADSMQTVLELDEDKIVFTEGTIYTPSETFDFKGDVVWGSDDMHTSWRVVQRNGGIGEATVHFSDSIIIETRADHVNVKTIPFADFKLNSNLEGIVTGFWNQNFDSNVGNLEASVDGEYQPFKLFAKVRARENGDTVVIERVEALHNHNRVEAEGAFLLPNDSNPTFNPTANLPIQVLHAWVQAQEFNIPLLLEPLNDSTLANGTITGNLAYNQGQGLIGNAHFNDIEFRHIPPQIFNIRKMNMFAQGSKVELNAYLGIGGGGWTGNTQVTLDNIFKTNRHVSMSHNSDNGGNLWVEGFIDSNYVFNGELNANGSWFIPGMLSEARRTDLHVDISAKLKEGLKGITADIRTDSTLYKPPKFNYLFPVKLRGHLENSILEINEALTQNDLGESVSGSMKYSLDSLQLIDFNFNSDHYTIKTKNHELVAENINGHLESNDSNVTISGTIPSIRYIFKDETYGNIHAQGSSNINLIIPHVLDGQLQNNTIEGNILIDKFVYKKQLDIEVTPSSINKFITLFNNFIAKLRKKEAQQEAKIYSASPINLSVHIAETQNDSVEIITPFAQFPFTFDIWVLGNTNKPYLRGDLGNSNNGFIGVKDLYEFDLNSFRMTWNNVPWQNGIVDVSSTQELPYCNEENDNGNAETCPVNFDIMGTITNPQPTPSSNCGSESSAAAIYYNIFLGCISDDSGEPTDWNKIAGKAIGKVLTTTANKTLGGEYIGDIDMKVMLFNNSTSSDKDSSYFKLPISLDRWVKDLSLIFGYTQDQSENPTYDQSLEFGLNYTLPVFKEKEASHSNHLNPSLSLNAQLISKQYITNTGTEGNENRIEKNIGFNYIYRFWNPCLLGFGYCETIAPTNETSKEKK